MCSKASACSTKSFHLMDSCLLFFAAADLACRNTVWLFSGAQSAGVGRRVHEAPLRVTHGPDSARRSQVAVVLDGIALVMLTDAHLARVVLFVRQRFPVEVVLVPAMVHAASNGRSHLRILLLLPATRDLAGRNTVRLCGGAQGAGLCWRVHEATLRVTHGQDTARSAHVAIVLDRVALIVLTDAHLAWLRLLARQGRPVETARHWELLLWLALLLAAADLACRNTVWLFSGA